MQKIKLKMAKKEKKYSVSDWKAFKKYFSINNSAVAKIVGIKASSVQYVTSPSYKLGLPTWATLAIWVWKRMRDDQVLIEAEKIKSEKDGI